MAESAAAPSPVISLHKLFSPSSTASRARFSPMSPRVMAGAAAPAFPQALPQAPPRSPQTPSQAAPSQAVPSQAAPSQAAPSQAAPSQAAVEDSKLLPVERPPPAYDAIFALYPLDRALIEKRLPFLPMSVITDFLKTRHSSGGGVQNVVNKGMRMASEVLLLQDKPPEFIARLPALPPANLTGTVSLYGENTGYRNAHVYNVEVTLSFRTLGLAAADVPAAAAHPTFDKVTKAACSCVIGSSGSCWHIFYLLLCASELPRAADSAVPVSPTSVLCRWNNPSYSAADAVASLRAVRSACVPLWSASSVRIGGRAAGRSPSWITQRNAAAQPDVVRVGARAAAVILAPEPDDDPSWQQAGRELFRDLIRAASRSVAPPAMPAVAFWDMSAEEVERVGDWFDADRLRKARETLRRTGAALGANPRADAGAMAAAPPWPQRLLYVGQKRRRGDGGAASEAPPPPPPEAPAPALTFQRPFFVKHAETKMLDHGHKYTQSDIANLPHDVATASFVTSFDPRIPFFCKFCSRGFYHSTTHFNGGSKCIRWEVAPANDVPPLLQRWQDAQSSPLTIPGKFQSFREVNPR